jgi:hypothetical protein
MSRTLAMMAILKENWNADRDYLSNFEPFVTDSLRRLPPGEVVEAPAVAKAVESAFDLRMPQGVIETLLRRALRSGVLEKAPNARERFVVPEELGKVPDLLQARGDAARDVRALLDALRAHAQQAGVEWTEDQAEQALMRFLDDSGTQFATARRRGRADELRISADQAKTVVRSFARHAVERDPEGLRLLEQAVKGSMLSNVLYFDNLGEFSPSMNNIAVYVDTPIVLRLLGVSTPQQIDASQELLKMLKTALIPVKIFAHTLNEVEGVLEGTAGNFHKSRSKVASSTMHLSSTGREVVEHFIQSGRGAADVEEILAELDHHLKVLGVRVEDRPDPVVALTVDEAKLDDALQTAVGYKSGQAKRRDLQSITAVHLLRRGRSARQLGDCQALFVTTNRALVRGSSRFFKEEGLHGGTSHLMTESEFVTQMWIRSPAKSPDLPRKTLIADAYAALNPPGRLWDKYVEEIEKLEAAGTVDEHQVARLVFSTSARSALLDLSLGDADSVEADTVGQVLQRADAALVDPIAQEYEAKQQILAEQQAAGLAEMERAYRQSQEARDAEHAAEVARLESDIAQRDEGTRVQAEQYSDRIEALKDQQEADAAATARRKKLMLRWGGSVALLVLASGAVAAVVFDVATGDVFSAALIALAFFFFAMAFVVGVGPSRRETAFKIVPIIIALTGIVAAYAFFKGR